MLRDILPALYSHRLDLSTMVAEVVAAGGLLASGLQPRLTAAAQSDLALLNGPLRDVSLQPRHDECWLQEFRGPSTPRSGQVLVAADVPPKLGLLRPQEGDLLLDSPPWPNAHP